MNRTRRFSLLFLLCLPLVSGCGDKVPSTAVSAIDFPPDAIFFNANDPANLVLLTGTAVDGVSVNKVEVSLDNGLTWKTAHMPAMGSHVAWDLTLRQADVPTAYNILLRATNSADNLETQHLVAFGTKGYSGTPDDLRTLIAGAGAGSYFLLSSGSGGAYSLSPGGVAPASGLTLVGAGSAGTLGIKPTVLSAGDSVGRVLSVSSPFTLRGVRVTGGKVGMEVASGTPLTVGVDKCYFGSQTEWAIKATGILGMGSPADAFILALSGTQVNAGRPVFGGFLGQNVNLSLFDCTMKNATNKTATSPPPGAVSLVSGSASTWIDSCLFTNNAVAINASATPALVTSCRVDGVGNETNGIRLNGPAGTSPRLRNNRITQNGGYGLAILGNTTPVLFRNSFTQNGVSSTGGTGAIFIKGSFAGPAVINLGNQLEITATGYNSFTGNLHNGSTVGGAIFLDPSTTGLTVLAENNWWGTTNLDLNTGIGLLIWDANDAGGTSVGVDYTPCLGTTP